MQDYISYIIKVIIISAIMYTYYVIALRNKNFHSYNRFYLLSIVFCSLILPFIKFDFFSSPAAGISGWVQKDIVAEAIVIRLGSPSFWNFETISKVLYIIISFILFVPFVHSLVRISLIRKRGHTESFAGYTLVKTREQGTPFSFFNTIFWNPAMPIHSIDARKMLNHELVHIKQGHTYDKLLMSLLLVVFWFNPIFWLVKKELGMIHEFLADQEGFSDEKVGSFAKIMLHSMYHSINYHVTNHFFYPPVKRRMMMLKKINKQKFNYIGRLMVLPLLACLFLFFTTKARSVNHSGNVLTAVTDTVPNNPNLKSLEVITPQSGPKVIVEWKNGKKETLTFKEARAKGIVIPPPPPPPPKLPPPPPGPPPSEKIFIKVETPAKFPGGQGAFEKYMKRQFDKYASELSEKDNGTCNVRFIVGIDGRVSDVKAENMKGTKLAEIAVNAIRKGPMWIPAVQNGRKVNSYRTQPVTLAKE